MTNDELFQAIRDCLLRMWLRHEDNVEDSEAALGILSDLEKRLSESDYERNKYSSEYYRMLDHLGEMRKMWLEAVRDAIGIAKRADAIKADNGLNRAEIELLRVRKENSSNMEAMRHLIDAAEYVLDNRSDRGDNPETGETVEVVLADSLDDLAEAFRRLNREKLTAS